METFAAEGCSCVGGGWDQSPLAILLIVGVLLAGSVLAAWRLRRRADSESATVGDDMSRVARVGLVSLTLPPPQRVLDDEDPDRTALTVHRDGA